MINYDLYTTPELNALHKITKMTCREIAKIFPADKLPYIFDVLTEEEWVMQCELDRRESPDEAAVS